ncbi:glycosyltransferase family protein [Kitasatospora purpeofusca]|uniref:hypothetical protein n=1 Tax=Kitasatospora purpeofusca TaxID=67352 RepID=UPI00381C1D51
MPDTPRAPRALFEIYDEGFDSDTWGGVETALWYLTEHLRRCRVEVRFYRSAQAPDPAALARLARQDRADAVFPLVDSPVFRGTEWARFPDLYRRVVRIWHDVSLLAPGMTAPPHCPQHGRPVGGGTVDGGSVGGRSVGGGSVGGGSGSVDGGTVDGCPARAAHPEGPMREVFLRDRSWTRCFPDRHYIPWAADHVPAADLRDPVGPVVLHLGKIPAEDAHRCLRRLAAADLPLRIVLTTWSRTGREMRDELRRHRLAERIEVIDSYDIRSDWKRVLGGARLLVLPSVFHETFNFLAAEAVQLGVPVCALGSSGSLPRFASLLADSVDELSELVAAGAAPPPRPRPGLGWHDVALRYADLIGAGVSDDL